MLPFLVSRKMKGCLTYIRGTSSIAGAEEDASNSVGTPDSGRASCGITGDSCMMIEVCWIMRLMLDARLDQREKVIVLPEPVKELSWLFLREGIGSEWKRQMSGWCKRMINRQVGYLNHRRCLGGDLMGVLFVCVFGSCVLKCRMMWSVRYIL